MKAAELVFALFAAVAACCLLLPGADAVMFRQKRFELQLDRINTTSPSYLDQYCSQYDNADDCSSVGGINDFYYYCVWDNADAICASVSHECPPRLAALANATANCGVRDDDRCPRSCRNPFLNLWAEACREAGLTHLDSFDVDPSEPRTAKVLADLNNCAVYRDAEQPYCDLSLDEMNRAIASNSTNYQEVSGAAASTDATLKIALGSLLLLLVFGTSV